MVLQFLHSHSTHPDHLCRIHAIFYIYANNVFYALPLGDGGIKFYPRPYVPQFSSGVLFRCPPFLGLTYVCPGCLHPLFAQADVSLFHGDIFSMCQSV